ncbi:MAG TPA: hypothetical protein VGL93_34890 [Streptosporangiaceae bacterium]|jgi:hypothetical protein
MSALRRPGRRTDAHEHRLDVLTLARRIGTLGTGMAVATGLVLCAIVEDTVLPQLDGRRTTTGQTPRPSSSRHHHGGTAAGTPTTPSGTLSHAVGTAATARLAAAARTTYGTPAAPRPLVRVTRQDRRRGWALGASVLPAPVGATAMPEAALFLAHRSGRSWTVGVGGTARFRTMVAHAPASVLPSRERAALTRYATGPDPGATPGGGTDTRLDLPWRSGRSWTLDGYAAGTLTFDPGDGDVRAAGPGLLYRLCGHGLLLVVHPDGLASEYAQVTDVTSVPDGGRVAAGAHLGQVTSAAPCRTGRTTARLRFALRSADADVPIDGVRIGAWTLHAYATRVWATCAGHRVDPGDPLPNAYVPASPSPVPVPSPTSSKRAPAEPSGSPTLPASPGGTTPPEVLK